MRIAGVIFLLSISFRLGECAVRQDCECGKANFKRKDRIVNGEEVAPNKYPWMAVMLTPYGNQLCGGSIISDRTILTAGHCMFYTKERLRTKWATAVHSIKETKTKGFAPNVYRTAKYSFHPRFRNSSAFDDFDMCMVTVGRPIKFGMFVKPICLPFVNEDKNFYNQKVTVAGWGKPDEDRLTKASDVLMETSVELKTPNTCKAMTKLDGYNTESMICAYEYDTDACMGDSGGPLFAETTPNRFIILGVVSFGEGCATEFPGVYAKVDEELTLGWIYGVTQEANSNFCFDPTSRRFLGLETLWNWLTGNKEEEQATEVPQPEENTIANPPPMTIPAKAPVTTGVKKPETPAPEGGYNEAFLQYDFE